MGAGTLHSATCQCGLTKRAARRHANGKVHAFCPHCDYPCNRAPGSCPRCVALTKASNAE